MNLFLSDTQKLLNDMIESGLEDLIKMRYRPDPWPATLGHYLDVLIAYAQGDESTIESLNAQLKAVGPKSRVLEILTQLRGDIIRRQISRALCETAMEVVQMDNCTEDGCDWSGELLIVVAFALETRGDELDACQCYQRAELALLQSGAKKKALRARHNAICVQSHADPERRILEPYREVYQQARRLKEYSLAGQSALNLCWEFILLKAYGAALTLLNRALGLLSRKSGSRDHDLALLQRSLVLGLSGRAKEAYLAAEAAAHNESVEVRSVFKLLRSLEEKNWKLDSPDLELLPIPKYWRQNLELLMRDSRAPLSPNENRVIYLLCFRARKFNELSLALYGNRMRPEVTKPRLEQLLSGLRKKRPDLIEYREGKYRLHQQTLG
ncbi:MAG: hypothetical protein A2428_10070 [Bdellovibrionales bacterium RIFOXYC1_FULL_54_43]|nr:MAG: hypothetical protein A2428_10070 [Bdellovibrionales bacterium RIFOXYC1_FULL_54_43]OFZ80529.1 MAG: hypothetical protein A2603_13165 [Bdellovibrionales bacterium RIFOXYD1_FULL_55_31]